MSPAEGDGSEAPTSPGRKGLSAGSEPPVSPSGASRTPVTQPAGGKTTQHTDADIRPTIIPGGPQPAPTTIEGYVIVRKLGEGGMGVVYEAEHTRLKRRVALKVMKASFAQDHEFARRFLREAQAGASIEHANVVAIYDFGSSHDQLWMALQYVGNGDLRSRVLSNGRFSEKEAAVLIAETANGLTAIHAMGLVHRDLKPENIFLDAKWQPKIGDLGLARTTEGDDRMTLAGAIMGTPAYMAPEQALGEAELDARTDVYSLGATLFYLVTATPPFQGKTAMSVVTKVIHEAVPDPRTINPAVSQSLSAIIRKAMAKDRGQRYQSAGDFAADLRAFTAGRAPTTIMTAMLKPSARQRRLGMAVGAVVALLAAGGGLAWWLMAKPSSPSGVPAAAGHAAKDPSRLTAEEVVSSIETIIAAPVISEDAQATLGELIQRFRAQGGAPDRAQGWEGVLSKARSSLISLRAAMTVLRDDPVLTATTIARSSSAVAAYAELVRKDDAILVTVQARSAEMLARISALRDGLAIVDRSQNPFEKAALRPRLVELGRLAGAEDPSMKRWSGLIDAAERERTALLGRLAILDDSKPLDGQQIAAIGPDLARVSALAGDQDAQIQNYTKRLSAAKAGECARLAKQVEAIFAQTSFSAETLAKLEGLMQDFRALGGDPAQNATWEHQLARAQVNLEVLQTAMKALRDDAALDLTTVTRGQAVVTCYAELVAKDDPLLLAVQGRCAELVTSAGKLRSELGAIDRDPTPMDDRPLRQKIDAYARLSGPDDKDVARWRGILDQAASDYAERVRRLSALDDPKPLTQAQITGAAADLAILSAKLGKQDPLVARGAARLDRERSAIAGLRQTLAGLDLQAPVPWAEVQRAAIALAQRLPPDDADLLRWNGRMDTIRGGMAPLLERLGQLDHSNRNEVLPFDALAGYTADLQALGRLIDDPALAKWAALIAERNAQSVAAARPTLLTLDQAAPLPPGIDRLLAQVRSASGLKPDEDQRWSAKIAKVVALKKSLGEAAASPAAIAPAQQDELVACAALVGDQDADVSHWRTVFAERAAAQAAPAKGKDGDPAAAGTAGAATAGHEASAPDTAAPARPPWAERSGSDNLGACVEILPAAQSLRFRWIPPGDFIMGLGTDREDTKHKVVLTHGFWMAATEVSQAQWKLIMGNNPSLMTGEALPVESVSWEDSKRFLDKLSARLSGKRARLPSEAEWEWAARSNQASAAWTKETAGEETHPVWASPLGTLGLANMEGNVLEWCQDDFAPYKADDLIDPVVNARSGKKVLKGGSWSHKASECGPAQRFPRSPSWSDGNAGLRVAIDG